MHLLVLLNAMAGPRLPSRGWQPRECRVHWRHRECRMHASPDGALSAAHLDDLLRHRFVQVSDYISDAQVSALVRDIKGLRDSAPSTSAWPCSISRDVTAGPARKQQPSSSRLVRTAPLARRPSRRMLPTRCQFVHRRRHDIILRSGGDPAHVLTCMFTVGRWLCATDDVQCSI